MLNIHERLAGYQVKNYFVFNTTNSTVDVFGPKVVEWHQKLIVLMDMLAAASEQNLQDVYDILTIRIVGLDTTDEAIRILTDNLSLCNKLLVEDLGESTAWKDIKGASLEKRHFMSISVVPSNPITKTEKNAKPTNKRKHVRIQEISNNTPTV